MVWFARVENEGCEATGAEAPNTKLRGAEQLLNIIQSDILFSF